MNKVKIMATEYTVLEVEQIDKGKRILGEIDYIEQVIKLEKGLNEDLKKEVLIHEILHGILEKLGFDDLNNDEQKVQSIASTLYQVLKDNTNLA